VASAASRRGLWTRDQTRADNALETRKNYPGVKVTATSLA